MVALLGAGPTLLCADNGPKGDYQGTIQTTFINQQYILQRGFDAIRNQAPDPTGAGQDPATRARLQKETQDIGIDAQNYRNKGYLAQLQQSGMTKANPFTLMIIDGGSGSKYALNTGPGNANYIRLSVGSEWFPTADKHFGTIQATWRADGFELIRNQGTSVFRIAGTYNGPRISGQWSNTENGTQMLAGVFNVSRSDGGGGTGGGGQQDQPVGLNGDYNGTIASGDANSASGHIAFTVTGSSIQGGVKGQWSQAPGDESGETPEEIAANREANSGSYSGTFSGAIDPDSGNFDTSLAGKIGDFDFTGHIRGSIQGDNAHGTWDATNQYGKSTGTWHATRPTPVAPLLGSNGEIAEIVDEQPPGISGVGDVPGPANLPESGTGILLPGLLAAAGLGIKTMLDSSLPPSPLVDYGPVVPDAGPPLDVTPPASEYGPEYSKAMQDSQDASDKYNAMKQQLADFENGADTTDPQYDVLKKQYTDYLDYYKQKADDSAATADSIAKAVELDRNTRVLKDFRGNDVKAVVYDPTTGQWHDSETGTLFDPNNWQQEQDQAAKDAAWGAADLDKMSAHQDAFSKSVDQIGKDEKTNEAKLDYLSKMNKMAFDTNLTDPGGQHDVFQKTQQMMNDILDGKNVPVPEILETRKYLHDSLLGSAAPESILSLPENQATGWNIAADTATGSIRELITGRNSDGHFTVAGVLGSIGLHIAGTAIAGPANEWVSEGLLTAVNTVYAEKDAIDHGATGWGALGAGALEAVMQGGVQAAGGLAMHYVPTNFPNLTAGIGEMMEPVNALGKRISNAVFPLNESQQITRNAVEKALTSDNPADLVALYKNGGMAKLGELQASGNLSKAEAMALNSKLAPIVNSEIDESTRLAMQQFQSRTGVKIEQSIIADSGSGARGGASTKAYTDFDRTHVTRFNQEDLEQYALDHSISVDEANQKLQHLYGNQITDNLDTRLRGQGFTHGTEDIHYNTYHGIGEGSGPADCYGAGWTGQRMKLQGVGTEYNLNNAGRLTGTRRITGTAVVDQHGINVAQATSTAVVDKNGVTVSRVMGDAPPNPDKFSPDEFQIFSKQQVNAANGHLDVKSVAKAMNRESDLANRVESMSSNEYGRQQLLRAGITGAPELNERLTNISKLISDNPAQADAILAKNKLTPIEFQSQVSDAIESYHEGIGGTLC